MNNPADNKFREQVLEKINSGKVSMHSKAYLIWRAAFWILALVILAAAAVFSGSFVIFALRASGVWDLPQFGGHGLQEFLAYFPWLFILAVLLLIWLMEVLARKYSLAYRIPVSYLILTGVIFIAAGSLAVFATPLHQKLYESANEDRLPLVGGVYRFFGQDHPDDFYVGDVQAASGTIYSIVTREGFPATIVANSHTVFSGDPNINAGDCIEAVGEENGNIVNAYNIKKIPASSLYPIRHYLTPSSR
jgi:hypothetical protein